MAVKSLNDAIKQGAYKPLCNGCGDVFDPNDAARTCKPEELHGLWHKEEITLYEDYWNDNSGAYMYVLRLADGSAAMGLNFLFDADWCKDTLKNRRGKKNITEKEVKATWMPRLFHLLSEAAERVIQKAVPDYDIYFGEDTDPDGHELMVVVPYSDRDEINGTVRKLYYMVYQAVEELFDRV